jgi:hypothetical protein
MFGAAGTVRRAEPLRHDALAAELAGLPVDDITVVVLVEDDVAALAIINAGLPGLERGTANMLTIATIRFQSILPFLMAA